MAYGPHPQFGEPVALLEVVRHMRKRGGVVLIS
jgi:hypothetical protein